MAVNPAQDPVLHLLRRATYGPTPELAAEVRRTGTTAWLDAQLHPLTAVPDTAWTPWPGATLGSPSRSGRPATSWTPKTVGP